jgi:hypothetical protein
MDNHGALVGWTHRDLGERLMVNIETVQSASAASDHHPDVLRIVMTRNQRRYLAVICSPIQACHSPSGQACSSACSAEELAPFLRRA